MHAKPCVAPDAACNPAADATSVPRDMFSAVWDFLSCRNLIGNTLMLVETWANTPFYYGKIWPSGPFPLPIAYDDGRVRDYGAVLPMNVPLKVVVSGQHIQLADTTGGALTPQGLPFQIQASDFQPASPSAGIARSTFFAPPDAKMVHVKVAGIQ